MTVPIPVTLRSHNMADLAYPDIQAYLKVCDLVLVPMAGGHALRGSVSETSDSVSPPLP